MTKTIFCDIDGCLLMQSKSISEMAANKEEAQIIPGTKEKILEWERKGFKLILTTGRKECYKKFTKWQLKKSGIYYDKLIMGVGIGKRILINDLKPDSEEETSISINLKRNQGITAIEID